LLYILDITGKLSNCFETTWLIAIDVSPPAGGGESMYMDENKYSYFFSPACFVDLVIDLYKRKGR